MIQVLYSKSFMTDECIILRLTYNAWKTINSACECFNNYRYNSDQLKKYSL